MARRNISPNRMELMRLKRELAVARRGHSLLKDKRDGMMRVFLEMAKENVSIRKKTDKLLGKAASAMALARAVIEPEVLGLAMQFSSDAVTVDVKEKKIMAVSLPQIDMQASLLEDKKIPQYSLAMTTADVDEAVELLAIAIPSLLDLASIEKQVQLLAAELEKTRRRVNSLEHILIPDLEENIRSIQMKMEENERDNLTRLMKVKDMILETEIKERRRRSEELIRQEREEGM